MVISNNVTTTGHIRIVSSSLIDFAFWILLQDGLLVPPFDKHTGGNQTLQDQGLNAQLWYDWLKLVLIRHDNRLEWHIPNIHEAAEASVKSFQELLELNSQIHNVICNEEWQNEQQQYYLEQLSQQERCYQEALADYPGLDINSVRESNPPQLWVGEQAIQEILSQFWDEYQTLKYSNSFINNILQTPRLWSIESHPPTNKYREVYLVNYPFEVEMFVEPIFCIVTVPNISINQEKLESRMKRVIEHS